MPATDTCCSSSQPFRHVPYPALGQVRQLLQPAAALTVKIVQQWRQLWQMLQCSAVTDPQAL